MANKAKKKSGKHLMIVESPAKARTLNRYLGGSFVIEASVGHVRDLPKSGLAVDVENGFEPQYVTIRGKGPIIKKLKAAAKAADDVLLATDPDREGEAIAYHIAEQLGYEKDPSRFRRVTFNELTRDAVLAAVQHPGELNMRLVEAQQARRILDRLVGYGLSPLLWRKISPVDPISRRPLSAGRVQSVAVRLLVERERERRAFKTASYWDLQATLSQGGSEFNADLHSLTGKRMATGADFDPATGALRPDRDVVQLDEAEAVSLAERLETETFRVASVEERRSVRTPYAPFTTSSLQQEANRKLNMSAQQTMRTAQRLYEAGHITYMRTDSLHLSDQAIEAARRRVKERYGDRYLSEKPRRFKTRTKGAQEAHEAIRPAGAELMTAEELGLGGAEGRLYDLIWKRMMATQMAKARLRQLTVMIAAGDALFRATGKQLEFAGFFRAYVEGSDDPEAALEDRETLLPALAEGDEPDCRELAAVGHETKPPARFTEATLVKALEAEGVGRPSTYAAIIQTIQDRGYAYHEGKALIPTFTAFAVTHLLEDHFPDLVDLGFTAGLESELDDIAAGTIDWRDYLENFYLGEEGFETRLSERESEIDPREASTLELSDLDPRVRIGRYGPFLEIEKDGESITASIPEGIPPADLSNEEAIDLLEKKAAGPTVLGEDPDTGLPVLLLTGRFGPYVQLGSQTDDGEKPRRASLPGGTEPEEVTLSMALDLLALPRELGPHPESGEPVLAGIGRYGPYVVHAGDYRSLKDGDHVLTVGLQRALELLAEPRRGRGRGGNAKPLRELGKHPKDEKAVVVMNGRYGPYVKHNRTNASLPKDMAVEDITLEQALELLKKKKARSRK
jgi:DNA topoisomerase-1